MQQFDRHLLIFGLHCAAFCIMFVLFTLTHLKLHDFCFLRKYDIYTYRLIAVTVTFVFIVAAVFMCCVLNRIVGSV